jgi:ABC-2 type transport system permease protein
VSTLLRYLRIAGHHARIGVIRKSQFRVEFAAQVVMDCIWYVVHVAVFEVLFLHANDIAGWEKPEIRVFLGFLFVSDGFMMMWMGQHWRFGRDLKDGKLDPFRVRPGSTLFLYMFQQFSVEAVLNVLIALAYLTWALSQVGGLGSVAGWLLLPCTVALACWARVVTLVFFSIGELWILNSEISKTVDRMFAPATDRPLDIFTRRVQLMLLYLVPVGVMTHAPAAIMLGRTSVLEAALHASWLVLFGLLVFAGWKRSFSRYESAMG